MRRAISMGLFDIIQAIILKINPEKHMILPVSQNDLEKKDSWSSPLEEVVVHTALYKTVDPQGQQFGTSSDGQVP